MKPRRQWLLAIAAIMAADVIALALSGSAVSGEQNPFTISGVFSGALLGEDVFVRGFVSETPSEHVSKKGYSYQQFFITDGEEQLKIFCSEKYGKTDAQEGDEIIFEGTFQKYAGTFELYGFCSEIKVL